MPEILPIVCDECQAEVHLITSIESFGAAPGARFFECTSCGHLQVHEFTKGAVLDAASGRRFYGA